MNFMFNGIWRKMSVSDYVNLVCGNKRRQLVYLLQIINISGYVGVLIALGQIPPVICVVGTPALALQFGITQEGRTIKESSKFAPCSLDEAGGSGAAMLST